MKQVFEKIKILFKVLYTFWLKSPLFNLMVNQSKSLGLTEFWFWPKRAGEGETQKSTHMDGKLEGLAIYAKTEDRQFQPGRLTYISYILPTPPSFKTRAMVGISLIRKSKAKVKPTEGPGFPLTPGGPGKPVVP